MVFLSAIIVAPDLWLSFLAKLNQEDQKNKTYLSVFACLVGACFTFTTTDSGLWIPLSFS